MPTELSGTPIVIVTSNLRLDIRRSSLHSNPLIRVLFTYLMSRYILDLFRSSSRFASVYLLILSGTGENDTIQNVCTTQHSNWRRSEEASGTLRHVSQCSVAKERNYSMASTRRDVCLT